MPRREPPSAPRRLITLVAVAASGIWLLPQVAWSQEPFDGQNIPPAFAGQGVDDANVEPLARGPVHEAFLSPMEESGQPSEVIPHQPPEPIDEIPPDAMPEGDPVWISGYWLWSETEDDFIWVSGVWRDPPPGQRWLPGYWEQAHGGWRWVAGFWAMAESEDLTYLDPPPESLEQGPSSPAPTDDYFWVSGCWIYQQGDYGWRPGYWARHQPGWIWVPHHYVWTPRGVLFCGGYWDYPVERRGTLFAPVWFRNRVYLQPGFRYTPSAVVVSSRLLLHLFVGPRWHHYYCGNYYGDVYHRVGLRPWFQHRSPILNYYSWHFGRQNVPYVNRLQSWFTYQNRHPDYRPPIYYRQQLELAQRATDRTALAVLTRPLRDVATDQSFVRLDARQRQRFAEFSGDLRTLARERVNFELDRRGVDVDRRGGDLARGRFNLPQVSRVFRPIIGDDDRGRPGRDDRPDFRDRPGSPGRPGTDRPGRDDRPDFRDRPGIPGRPGTDRPGRDDRPDLRDRPGFPGRPGTDRPGVDRPGVDRPGVDRPGVDRPGADRPGADRPGADRPGRDGRSPLERLVPGMRGDDRTPGTRTPDARTPSRRPDIRTPDIRRPDARTPATQRPGIQRPDTQRPDTQRPSIQRPDTQRPNIQVPGRSTPGPGSSRPSFTPPGRSGSSGPSASPGPSRPSVTPSPSGRSPGRSGPSASPGRSRPSFTPPGRSGSSGRSASPGPSRPSVTPSPGRSPGRSGPSASPGRSRPSVSPGPSGASRGPARGSRSGGRSDGRDD